MKAILRSGFLTLAIMAFASSANAGPLDDGVAAYQRGDYAAALRLWRPLAEQGDADAQYNLGVMYDNGRGVQQDDGEAVKWFRKAAEKGFAKAQCNLGSMYEEGKGVPQDYAEALTWYRIAAEQGHAGAQYNLGTMYYNGLGVPQEHILGCMWFDIAAASGSESAINSPDFVARMTPDQIAVAKRMARERMVKHQQ